jgi:hypothetical protein
MLQSERAQIKFEERVERAASYLEARTLPAIPDLVGRLVYLASTRDYNTGQYHHAGLALRFDADSAAAALRVCHERIFRQLLLLKLEDITDAVEAYMRNTDDRSLAMDAWVRFKAYQLLVPAHCDQVSAGLFCSNVRLALAVLTVRETRKGAAPEGVSGSERHRG